MDTISISPTSGDVSRPEKPTTAVCDGCGERFPRGELIDLHDDNHDNLTYFHGDRLCAECADAAGVLY